VKVIQGQVCPAGDAAGLFQGLILIHGNNKLIAVIIPCRNPVTPPQLPADAPVMHILHPVPVNIPELVRVEPDSIIHHRIKGRLGDILHLQEPLQ